MNLFMSYRVNEFHVLPAVILFDLLVTALVLLSVKS